MESTDIYQIILSVLSGEATEDENKLLINWINESEKNRGEYYKMHQLYLSSFSKKKKGEYDMESAWLKVCGKTLHKKKTSLTAFYYRYAAVAILLVILGLGLLSHKTDNNTDSYLTKVNETEQPILWHDNGVQTSLEQKSFIMQKKNTKIKSESGHKLIYESSDSDPSDRESMNRLVIPKGKTFQLILSDGTNIWLNAETEIIYPSSFGPEKREVTLRGEAYFDVAKDKNRPFHVKADEMDIQVLGTSFNVNCYENEKTISTTLVEGSVKVITRNGKERIIVPSEQLSYEKENRQITIQEIQTDLYTSWIKGEYIFKNASLAEIFSKLERWYPFTVHYENESLRKNRFSLVVNREMSIDQIIEIINFPEEVKIERIDNQINVSNTERRNQMRK